VIRLVQELAAEGFPVAVACRVLEVAPSTYYEAIGREPSARALEDRELTGLIVEVHEVSRGTYGAPRVHAELRLGRGLKVGRKRVARLMRCAGIHGVSHRRKTRHRPDTATHDDLVRRRFTADGPDRVWFTDITQHRAADGWVYCCAVVDAWSRRVVGWSIADHVRSELVVDALEMARWQRSPDGTIVHADRGTQGEFNWSSQHLDDGGVCGKASWMDDGAHRSWADEIAGLTVASTGSRAGVLARDRHGFAARGGGARRRRVTGSRCQVVPPRWRHVSLRPAGLLGPVSDFS
jgi:hypothetical protein